MIGLENNSPIQSDTAQYSPLQARYKQEAVMNELISTQRLPDKSKTIKLLPSQYRFMRSQAKSVLYSGGYGSGKSRILCYVAIREAVKPANTVLIVRKTMTSLKKSTLLTLIGDDGVLPKGCYNYNKQDGVIQLNGGGQILLAGCDDFNRLRSMNLGCICIDEASELNATEYQELLYRLRLEAGTRQLYMATNPATQSHFLYRLFFKDPSPNREVIQACSLENHHLPADYIASLKEMDGQRFQKFVMGAWVSLESAVYDLFNRDQHVKSMDPMGDEQYYLGIDVGYRDPTCLLVVGRTGEKLRIVEEIYRNRMLLNEVKTAVIDLNVRYPGIRTIIDPSAALIGAELNSIGLATIKANNDIMVGINRVRSRLINRDGSPDLLINEYCLNTIREMESYQFKDGTDKPITYDDHSMDPLRYVVNYIDDMKCQYSKPLLIDLSEQDNDEDEDGYG